MNDNTDRIPTLGVCASHDVLVERLSELKAGQKLHFKLYLAMFALLALIAGQQVRDWLSTAKAAAATVSASE